MKRRRHLALVALALQAACGYQLAESESEPRSVGSIEAEPMPDGVEGVSESPPSELPPSIPESDCSFADPPRPVVGQCFGTASENTLHGSTVSPMGVPILLGRFRDGDAVEALEVAADGTTTDVFGAADDDYAAAYDAMFTGDALYVSGKGENNDGFVAQSNGWSVSCEGREMRLSLDRNSEVIWTAASRGKSSLCTDAEGASFTAVGDEGGGVALIGLDLAGRVVDGPHVTDLDGTLGVKAITTLNGAPVIAGKGYVRKLESDDTWSTWDESAVEVRDVQAHPNGELVIAGHAQAAMECGDVADERTGFVAMLDEDLQMVWCQRVNSETYGAVRRVAVTLGGGIFLVGSAGRSGEKNAFVAAYDRDGQEHWLVPFGTDADEESIQIALRADGRIVMSGQVRGRSTTTNPGSVVALTCPDESNEQRSFFVATLECE